MKCTFKNGLTCTTKCPCNCMILSKLLSIAWYCLSLYSKRSPNTRQQMILDTALWISDLALKGSPTKEGGKKCHSTNVSATGSHDCALPVTMQLNSSLFHITFLYIVYATIIIVSESGSYRYEAGIHKGFMTSGSSKSGEWCDSSGPVYKYYSSNMH